MPPQDRHKPASSGTPKAELKPPRPATPCLPQHRAASIGELTAKARSLHAEAADNLVKIDSLQLRNAAIRRELDAIDKQVREHAWDGQPLA